MHATRRRSSVRSIRACSFLELVTQDGMTALMLAARDGNYFCVRFLLDEGADPNVQCEVRAFTYSCERTAALNLITHVLKARKLAVALPRARTIFYWVVDH